MTVQRIPAIIVDKDADPSIQHMATDINAAIAALNKRINALLTTIAADFAPYRTPATADVSLFVNGSTGSDSNPGTSALPFATISAALTAMLSYDGNGFAGAINVAAGTYTGATVISSPFFGFSSVSLVGDTTTPSNVVINTTSATCITVQNQASIRIRGFKLTNSGSGFFSGIDSLKLANVTIDGNMNYGSVTGDHLQAANTGYIEIDSNYSITGGSGFAHWATRANGTLVCEGRLITLSGTPSFGAGFADCTVNGNQRVGGNTFSGSGTGKHFRVISEGVLFTNFVSANTYLPGNANGSWDGTGYVVT